MASTRATTSPARRLLATLLATALAVLALPAPSAEALTDFEAVAETVFHQAHLDTRQDPTGNGVTDFPAAPAIDGRTDLLQTARAWSSQMASDNQLKHNPDLADEVCCWMRVGENVAVYRGDLSTEDRVRAVAERLMTAWIDSDGHRRNIMDDRWDEFAVGVVIRDGAMWATGVFRTLDGSTTPPGTTYGADGPHGDAGRASTQADGTSGSSSPTAEPTARDTSDLCDTVQHDGYADSNGTVHGAAIRCASGLGLANGRSADQYDPAGAVTRAQVMAFLRRAVEEAGHTLDPAAPDYFSDDDGTVHEQSANMLAHAGFVVVPDGLLRPGEPASRAFIASVAGRAIAELVTGPAAEDYFGDDDGHADEAWINVLAEAGVVTGDGNGGFGPDAGLSRAQIATVLVRTFDALQG